MKLFIHLFFGLTTFGLFAQPYSADTTDHFTLNVKKRSTTLLAESIRLDKIVGAAAAIYMHDTIIWADASGHMNREKNQPATPDMIHRIASISKPMTAIAILQLKERGLLNLEDRIQRYIPDFPEKKEGAITIRHLLQHSSGVKHYKNEKEGFPTKNYPSLRKAVELFEGRRLASKPGEGFHYTTYGYTVLGLVIEKVSGMSYREYMKKHVWEKAGMTDTDVEVFGQSYPNKSKLYTTNKKGQFVTDKATNLSVKIPGGGIQSTVLDLLKFAKAILTNQLVAAETLELMVADSGVKQKGNPYGLGWFIYGDEKSPGGRLVGHSGAQSGTSAQLNIFLDKKAAVVVLSNTAKSWNEVFGLADRLGSVIVNPEQANRPIRKVVNISAETLNRYVGEYTVGKNTVVKLTRAGAILYGEIEGGSRFKLYPASDTDFFLRNQDLQLEFEEGSGKAIGFVLIQNGERHMAKRR